MTTIVTKTSNGGPISDAQMDANLNNLNNDKLETSAVGVTVQAYDATILNEADIGVSVQAYDVDTAKTDVKQSFSAQQTPMDGSLTDGATIDWNGDVHGQVVTLTLGGNRTMNAPTNIVQNTMYLIRIAQDATGSRTLAWDAAYKFGSTGAPTLTTTASKVDFVSFMGGAGNTLECVGVRLNAV